MKDTHQPPVRQGFAAWLDSGRVSVLAHDAPDSTIGPSSAASSGVSR